MHQNNKTKLYGCLSIAMVLGIWQVLTFFFSPIVVPSIGSVGKSLVIIFTHAKFYHMIGLTIIRQMTGIAIGVGIGLIVGIYMGRNQIVKGLVSPLIHLFQTIPPVSWVVLALVWFGFNGKPAIFIVVIATIPLIAINVCEGIENIDAVLMEMADLYRFSMKKKMRHVILPSIFSYFNSGLKVALGNGWKIAVMGEVLTTSDGIGGMIKTARLNVEPENIIAWSIVIVFLFYLFNWILEIVLWGGGNLHALRQKSIQKL